MITLLTQTSKMPCKSLSLPRLTTCPTGSKIAKDQTSVCAACYAAKGMYLWPDVSRCQQERFELTKTDAFVPAMVTALTRQKKPYFRWHDSGDIYSYEYLLKILEIVKQTPQIFHRIPTREVPFIKRLLSEQDLPQNLCVQISANYLDTEPACVPAGCQGSMVVTDLSKVPAGALICKATTAEKSEDKKCGDCRACWHLDQASLIAYKKH